MRFLRSIGQLSALAGPIILIPLGAANAEELSIGHYPGFRFTAAVQDRVREINMLAAEGEGQSPTNTSCEGLNYRLVGLPKEYDRALPKYIYGPEDVELFRNSPYKIHIVSEIRYCDGRSDNFHGCTFPGGPLFLSKRAVNHPNAAALMFLHELGHLHGLDFFADSHNPSFRNFMYLPIRHDRRGKLEYQCNALKGAVGFSFIAPAQAQVQESEKFSLEDFVGGVWPHGLPAATVQKLTDEQLSQVRQWVVRNEYEFWPNAVTILGLRGINSDIELLQKVLNDKSENAYAKSAKLNVPRALGLFAYRTKNRAAFQILRQLMSPHYNSRFLGAPLEDEATVLALEATQGMAIFAATGSAEALKSLEEQQFRTERGEYSLGVGPSFFKQTERLRQSVEKKGVIEGLRVQD